VPWGKLSGSALGNENPAGGRNLIVNGLIFMAGPVELFKDQRP